MAAVSQALEGQLGFVPAVRPGLPPERATRTKKAFDKIFGFSNSATVLLSLGVVFVLSLAFPVQSSKALLGAAYLYHLLSEAPGLLAQRSFASSATEANCPPDAERA